jgi:hypothetical protein
MNIDQQDVLAPRSRLIDQESRHQIGVLARAMKADGFAIPTDGVAARALADGKSSRRLGTGDCHCSAVLISRGLAPRTSDATGNARVSRRDAKLLYEPTALPKRRPPSIRELAGRQDRLPVTIAVKVGSRKRHASLIEIE